MTALNDVIRKTGGEWMDMECVGYQKMLLINVLRIVGPFPGAHAELAEAPK